MRYFQLSFDHQRVVNKETVYVYKFVPISASQIRGAPLLAPPVLIPGTRVEFPDPEGTLTPFIVMGTNAVRTLTSAERMLGNEDRNLQSPG